jgi:hypothetical protein
MDARVRARLEKALVIKHGAAQATRVKQGLAQVLARWRREDGDEKQLTEFVLQHFIVDEKVLQDTARRLEYALEMLDGHGHEIQRELSRFQTLDEGPSRPIDALLAAHSPNAHVTEDLFKGRIAFVALLNFPLTTLEQRLGEGRSWSRARWALARLTARFEFRLPAAIVQEIDRTSSTVEGYIDRYNIHLGKLAGPAGSAGFPAGLKLISHWGLRDEIRGQYGRPGALERQRVIARVMERIIRQELPQAVIDDGSLEWDVSSNRVRGGEGEAWRTTPREVDTRYAHLLSIFRAIRKADPYYPGLPTHIDRVFSRDREMPERRMRALLESVVTAPVARRIGALIAKRLGRPLEPFDIWYAGFRPRASLSEAALDKISRQRYPDAKALHADLPRILGRLGFSEATARFLAEHIVIDPARGAGHASGAHRRDDKAHLRTRIGRAGMDYKGFNIATHELGHNVEQVFSMSRIDHTLLEGVPNTGFTEAFAFLFQAHDLELLGQKNKDPQAEALKTLDRFWSVYEIAGVGLLDMEIWRWMYDHPTATAAELREATVRMAQQLWNRYYAPVFGVRDVVLPAIYSHIIAFGLYTPDYPLGYLITFQLERHLASRKLGPEMERMCRLGRLAPDVWMQQAVGSDISSAPLLQAAEAAARALSR